MELKIFSIIFLLVKVFSLTFGIHVQQLSNVGDDGSASGLFLTPLINSGAINEAQSKAKVTSLPKSSGVTTPRDSYSGFITVQPEYDSNLFFWYFPAKNYVEGTTPLLLWLEGGPGYSSLLSVFNHNGPYKVVSSGNLEERVADWTVNHSMIYLENPIGAGFSFTNDSVGVTNSSEAAATNTLGFLRQFFKLFPEVSSDPFYIAGESYGAGHFSPTLMSAIHKQNTETSANNPSTMINLKGMALFAPWVHPIVQTQFYADYMYGLGLIDAPTMAHFRAEESKMKNYIMLKQEFVEAQKVMMALLVGSDSSFTNASGYTSIMNALSDKMDSSSNAWVDYVQTPEFRSTVHVGHNSSFMSTSSIVQAAFSNDFMDSKLAYIEEILNSTNYQVIVVSAQFDMVTVHSGIQSSLEGLNWDGATEFKEATRHIWKSESNAKKEVAGYIKKARNLTYVMMRNAGHFPIGDQPDWSLELLRNWLKNY